MDNIYISTILESYKETALVPSPVSATLRCLTGNLVSIYSTWSSPDVIRSESTKFSREFLLQIKSGAVTSLSAGVPTDTSFVSKQIFTKSGNRYAVFRKTKKIDDAIFLEVWNSCKKECTIDLTDSKVHGKVLDSGTFASFEWSSDEKHILYVADAHKKKTESYFKNFFCQSSDEESTEKITKGEEFLYKESWGECETTSHHTVLCIFDVSSGKVEVLNIDEKFPNISVAQAVWGPKDEYIVFVGYIETPFRLGILHCKNRRSAIFSYNLKTKVVERLTEEENVCVESPIFSPDFQSLLFLQNKSGGPHKSCKKLMKYDWKTKEIKTVVDIVDEYTKGGFTGVYCDELHNWWSSDSRFFFFESMQRSFSEIYYVNIITSEVKKIPYDERCSKFLLDVKEPYILAYASSSNKAPFLIAGEFSTLDDKIETTWNIVEPQTALELPDISWDSHTVQPAFQHKTYSHLDFDVISIYPKEKKNGTLIVWPHGGPHSAFLAAYCPMSAAFAKLGYIVCKVNYRGSTGFGENSIQSLPGNIGTQDVSDVVNAIVFMKEFKDLDIKQVVGFGGSHGGFLIAHLVGQFPDLLKAAVLRNPVIDLTSMIGVSDIPDWCWVEAGFGDTYDESCIVGPSNLENMWQKSPIKYIKSVVAPTLLCLGKVDLRVPPSQGLLFHRHLRAQNVATNVYYYDDSHSLSKVGVSTDNFVQIALWFKTYSDL